MIKKILNFFVSKPKINISVKCANCRIFKDITDSKDIKMVDKKVFKKCPLELKWITFDTESCDILDPYRKELYYKLKGIEEK